MSNKDRFAIGLILLGMFWLFRSVVTQDASTALAKGIIGEIFYFVGLGGFVFGNMFNGKDNR